jgi:hypothetical protein
MARRRLEGTGFPLRYVVPRHNSCRGPVARLTRGGEGTLAKRLAVGNATSYRAAASVERRQDQPTRSRVYSGPRADDLIAAPLLDMQCVLH